MTQDPPAGADPSPRPDRPRDPPGSGRHPRWCAHDVRVDFDGIEHLSQAHRMNPSYQHEVAIVDRLSQVVYPGDGAETPAAVLRIENPTDQGEVAMTADDVTALVERLLRLRDALVEERGHPA